MTREMGKVVNPEAIIEKIAATYLNVHPYVLHIFMSEQQEAESLLDIFLLGKFAPVSMIACMSILVYES